LALEVLFNGMHCINSCSFAYLSTTLTYSGFHVVWTLNTWHGSC